MTTWGEDPGAPASGYVEPGPPGSAYETEADLVEIPDFSSWDFSDSPSGVETVKYHTAPDCLKVGTEFVFFGSPDDGSAICSFQIQDGQDYEIRRWVNGSEAQEGGTTFQRLVMAVDRGDGAFLALSTRNPSAAPGWTEFVSTFSARGTVGRLRFGCQTQLGSPTPVGTHYWYVDDVVLRKLPPTYTEDPGGATPWVEE